MYKTFITLLVVSQLCVLWPLISQYVFFVCSDTAAWRKGRCCRVWPAVWQEVWQQSWYGCQVASHPHWDGEVCVSTKCYFFVYYLSYCPLPPLCLKSATFHPAISMKMLLLWPICLMLFLQSPLCWWNPGSSSESTVILSFEETAWKEPYWNIMSQWLKVSGWSPKLPTSSIASRESHFKDWSGDPFITHPGPRPPDWSSYISFLSQASRIL